MTRITCVHQGYELYGSDRSFVESVRVIRASYPQAFIEVLLPSDGPIVAPLRDFASKVTIVPLWVLRRRDLPRLATLGLLRLPLAVGRALWRLRRSDLVYVNTCVVADYLLAAGLSPGRTIVHVHEIPEGMVRQGLRALLRGSRAEIVFNSRATQAAFALPARIGQRVVYNGIADPGAPKGMGYDGTRPLRLLMLGRISRIKGQDVLLEALAQLPEALKHRIAVRIVGSAFEDEARERALAETILASGLAGTVTCLPFVPDPGAHFRWADVVAVPSRLPESLGRVAIEAMAHGVPPIVSRIGGLPEVVEHGRTGWIVPPGRADALAQALAAIIAEPDSWSGYPAAARARYERIFAQGACAEALSAALEGVLGARASRAPAPAGSAVYR
ncbi:glycosyltransferase [Methylobacterium organophilum]|uniref:glycosyltransferase family 4 protein n=1 Tax=Methylobacterium organophilum TaxID=410 RepID=UPI001F136C4B|nr:glycosyltransferase [Methylobacterium organophilum]UMY16043.1 glycosyltransferase [Methylobacterium organophilum]